MKLIYIAGPYRSETPAGIVSNIARARVAALDFAAMGVPYICPHLNAEHFDVYASDVPDQFYLDLGIELLSRCDGMFVLSDYERSAGTLAEIDWWRDNRLEDSIFYQSSSMWKIDMLNWIKNNS